MTKITVVGAGHVGVEIAKHVILRRLAKELVLIDINLGRAQGEALDLGHMAAMLDIDVDVYGTNDYSAMSDSDVVVISAGFARKSGMTREQLIYMNACIVAQIANEITKYAPKSTVIVVTNPVEPMTYTALHTTGFERNRVIGFGSLLDTARMKYYVAKRLGKSYSSVTTLVIGEHGEKMIPLTRLTYVEDSPLIKLLPPNEIEKIVEEVRKCGAKIIELRGWSSYHAPGAGVALMIESILKDLKKVYPVAIELKGEYGYRDVVLSVPAVIGRSGVEKIIELELDSSEKKALDEAARLVKELIDTVICRIIGS